MRGIRSKRTREAMKGSQAKHLKRWCKNTKDIKGHQLPNSAACEVMSGSQAKPLKHLKRWCKNTTDIKGHPLIIPDMESDDEVEEVKRLMKRNPTVKDEPDGDYDCGVCFSKDHYYTRCPYLKQIPAGEVIGSEFDMVCIGCGKIGEICCSKGAYAIPKWCYFCSHHGHWYWEDRCHWPNICNPWGYKVFLSIKNSMKENKREEEEVMVNFGKEKNIRRSPTGRSRTSCSCSSGMWKDGRTLCSSGCRALEEVGEPGDLKPAKYETMILDFKELVT